MRQSSRSYPRRLSTLSTTKVTSMPPLCVEQALETRTVQCVNTGHLLKRMKGLKKLKRKMGLASRWSGSATLPQSPLFFHNVCGDNSRVSHEGRIVRRTQSFCKGIAFSNRPVRINEKVYIRLLEVSSNWSGVLRFGFTAVNPESMRGCLPKYVCPDLTSRNGYWAKALHERYGKQGSILHFSVNSAGDVIYGMDDTEVGVFLSNVDVRSSLWVVVDVYGNSTSLQFVDPCTLLNNSNEADRSVQIRTSNGAMSNRNTPAQPAQPYPSSDLPEEVVNIPGFGSLRISDPTVIRAIVYETSSNALPLNVHQNVLFSPLSFHSTKGSNISFTDHNRTIAQRNLNEYSKGYVFTGRTLEVNEKIVIQVLANEPHYVGAMAFGVTSANPANLSSNDLPEDCDELLDRSEYWVVCKDVAASPKAGDELSFTYSSNGQITFAKNNGSPHVIMHVDSSLQLYAFFDVFGHTAKLRMLGSVKVPDPTRSMEVQHRDLQRRLQNTMEPREGSSGRPHTVAVAAQQQQRPNHASSSRSNLTASPQHSESNGNTSSCGGSPSTSNSPASGSNLSRAYPATVNSNINRNNAPSMVTNSNTTAVVNLSPVNNSTVNLINVSSSYNNNNTSQYTDTSDCSVCYEKAVDSVLYSCGHMCMCYQCALQQWRGRGGGMCPICRAVIKDVIRTYKS
uniref:Protein neuralized n=2 Tax=Hirondellea gigas TaxID=1518452 RepID=A0A2P2HZT2_9CRUS